MQADKQRIDSLRQTYIETDRQADRVAVIAILRTPPGGKVIKHCSCRLVT